MPHRVNRKSRWPPAFFRATLDGVVEPPQIQPPDQAPDGIVLTKLKTWTTHAVVY